MRMASMLVLAAALASARSATAGSSDLERGDDVIDLMAGYSDPGSDLDAFDRAAAGGCHYYHHVTDRLGVGAGIESYSYSYDSSGFSGFVHSGHDEIHVTSVGPFARFVFNPGSPVRGYVSGGVTYNQTKESERVTYSEFGTSRYESTKAKAGGVLAGGAELPLGSVVSVGAEARFGYLDFKTDRRATQMALALRLGFQF